MKLTGDLISQRMKELKLTKMYVSKTVGTSRPTLDSWIDTDKKPHDDTLDKLLDVLDLYKIGTDVYKKEEATKQDFYNLSKEAKKVIYAPVLDYVQAGHFTSLSNIDTSELEQIILPPNVDFDPDKDFIVKVNGDSMLNKSHKKCLYPDEYLVVDTKKNYHIGDIVVAYIEGNNEATVKLLTGEVGNMYLEPLNEKYLGRDGFVIPKGSQVTIKGVVKAVIPPARQFIS
ncbi:LexA family protein [Francisella marina]|uniref:LexA family protein n=1 Tax=Francisella marina TaxID=2249302 RepID=UPI0011ED06DB|nr:S24 family peptidase [Francisella marina]QEO58297.1 hypothetical protein F0R75_00370 [Francisella marina]